MWFFIIKVSFFDTSDILKNMLLAQNGDKKTEEYIVELLHANDILGPALFGLSFLFLTSTLY